MAVAIEVSPDYISLIPYVTIQTLSGGVNIFSQGLGEGELGMFTCFNIACIISALTDGSIKTASRSLQCEYCAHFQIQLKEGEWYRRGGTRVNAHCGDDIGLEGDGFY